MTPGPTRVPERVLRAGVATDDPSPHAGVLARARDGHRVAARPCSGRRLRPLPVHTTGSRRARGGDLQSVLGRRRDRGVLQRQVRRDVGGVRRVVRRASSTASRRAGSAMWTRRELQALLGRASIGPRGGCCLWRHVDRRGQRRRGDRAGRPRTRRARLGRRRLVARRNALRVRRVGDRRRRHRVAEMS